MLRLLLFLPAAAASCSDSCTHPGVKVIDVKAGGTIQDCSGYGPGLSTPATPEECEKTIAATKDPNEAVILEKKTANDINFNLCAEANDIPGISIGTPTGPKSKTTTLVDIPIFCKCSACPSPSTSSSTGTGWTLAGIALGAAGAGVPIAYGAARL